jgi:hypothetical protein
VLRKPFFWIGHLALVGLVSFGPLPAEASQTRSASSSKPAATKASSAKKKTVRRQPSAAQLRAAAERAAAEAAVPRYKVDESGEIVPDLRAAAGIIYSPATGNAAARALARVSPHGPDGFIDRMNAKAVELGLTSTHYADPSGLLSANVSSAYDMARLIAYASSDDRMASIMRKPEHTVRTRTRKISFRSTNHLLARDEFDVMGGKTGFISKAGYCLATLLRLPQSGQEVAVVVLGARTNAGRFLETQNLFSWLSNQASAIFATATGAPD